MDARLSGVGQVVRLKSRTILSKLSNSSGKRPGDKTSQPVLLGKEAFSAVMVASRPKAFPPNAVPRLFSHAGPGPADMATGPRRYKVVFEVPKQAAAGKLRWADTPEVNWSIGQTAWQ